jgi:hypothetical protein
MKTLLAVIVAGLCCLTAKAEDWTVKGKTYHNVTVTKADPDKIHIMYDGGIGSVDLADLPPDLQRRFKYDPQAAKAAEKAEAAKQAESDKELAAELARQPKIVPAADPVPVEEVKKHPMDMIAKVISCKGDTYVMLEFGWNDDLPNGDGSMTIGDIYTKNAGNPDYHPLALRDGGQCYLVTKKIMTVSQQYSATVYAAGYFTTEDGDRYARFADDPEVAAQLQAQPTDSPTVNH